MAPKKQSKTKNLLISSTEKGSQNHHLLLECYNLFGKYLTENNIHVYEGRSIVLRRPIQHLIPLELPSTSEEDDHVSEVRETPLVEQLHLVVPTARNDARSRRNAAIIGKMLRKANKH